MVKRERATCAPDINVRKIFSTISVVYFDELAWVVLLADVAN